MDMQDILQDYLHRDVLLVVCEYLVMHIDLAFNEVKKYKLGNGNCNTILIKWEIVEQNLNHQVEFDPETITCEAWYYQALISFGLLMDININYTLECLQNGSRHTCDNKGCHDKCDALYLAIIYHHSLSDHLEGFKKVLNLKPYLLYHPFMICEFSLQGNRHWINVDYKEKWEIVDNIDRITETTCIQKLIDSISQYVFIPLVLSSRGCR